MGLNFLKRIDGLGDIIGVTIKSAERRAPSAMTAPRSGARGSRIAHPLDRPSGWLRRAAAAWLLACAALLALPALPGLGGVAQAQVDPAADVSLSSLGVRNQGDLRELGYVFSPSFDAATTEYSGSVDHGVEMIGVYWTASDASATVTVVDAMGMELADANLSLRYHQVPLTVGTNTIGVKVTAGTAERTYRLTVERQPACPTVPTQGGLWSACLTVGSTSTSVLYNFNALNSDVGWNSINGALGRDSLSSTAVTLPDDSAATITRLINDNTSPGTLVLHFGGTTTWLATETNRNSLSLSVGGQKFAFADGSWSGSANTWTGSGLQWDNGEPILVSLAQEGTDTTPAKITSVDFTSDPNDDGRDGDDDTYRIGDAIEATVTFGEAVTATGTPRLALQVGGDDPEHSRWAGYQSGSGSTKLVFKYFVNEDDEDTDGVSIDAGDIDLNGGTIQVGTTDAALAHGAVAASTDHKVDGVRPILVSATVESAGITITLVFDEGLLYAPFFNAFDPTANFSVTADGNDITVKEYAAHFGVNGLVVDIELNALDPGITSGQDVTVSYTPTTHDDPDTPLLQDVAGNSVAAFTTGSDEVPAVVNNTRADLTPPALESATVLADGTTINLVFDDELDDNVTTLASILIAVTADGNDIAVGEAVVSVDASSTRRLVEIKNLSPAITHGQDVTVEYSDPDNDNTSVLQDAAGNDVASFTTGSAGVPAVVNNVPVPWSVTVDSSTIAEDGGVATVTVGTGGAMLGEDTTITLTPGTETNAATPGTDFTIANSAGTVLSSPYTLTLAMGEMEVAATITAVADTIEDDNETVTITAMIGTEQIGEPVTVTIIATAPAAVAFTSDPNEDGRDGDDDTYRIGDAIEATVTFGEAVTATGTPRLALQVGGDDPEHSRWADYQSGSGSTKLVFKYFVNEDDEDTDGVSIDAGDIDLNGGTIQVGTTDAALAHGAVAASTDHKVDGVRPIFVSAETSEDGESILVTFSENIASADPDKFELAGKPPNSIASASPMGSIVVLGLKSNFAITYNETVSISTLASIAVRDAVGNSNHQSNDHAITNNVPEPAVSIADAAITSTPVADGNYAIGESIEVTVTFGEAVTVTGTPRLALQVGGDDPEHSRWADYQSGSGSTKLVFKYFVNEDDEDTDGVSIDAGDIDLNGGTIQVGTTDAALAHGAVAADSDHKVDGVRPILVSATTSEDGMSLVLTFSEGIGAAAHVKMGLVAEGSTTQDTDRRPTQATFADRVVTVTLREAVGAGMTWTLALLEGAVTDSAGNANVHSDGNAITNTVPDTRLSALSLGTIVLIPAFDAEVRSYAVTVENSVSTATLTATAHDMDATVAYLDTDGAELSDADADTVGFQVALAVGETTIRVQVTAANTTTTAIYEVTVTRAAADATVCAWTPAAGETVVWSGTILVGDHSTQVDRAGWEIGIITDYGSLSGSPSFTYKGLSYSLSLINENNDVNFYLGFVDTTSDHVDDIAHADSKLTFRACSTALALSSASTAGAVSVFWLGANIAWTAGDSIGVALTTSEPGAPALTAAAGVGSVTLNWTAPSSVGGSAITGYQYRRSSDGGSTWSPDWTDIPSSASLTSYDVTGLTGGTAYTFQLRARNSSGAGLYSEEASATPTAVVWSVTAEPDVIGEEGGVSTVSVRTNDVEFTEARTITLTLGTESTAATPGTDFTVADSSGATLASPPYTLTLAQGEVEVAVLVTAVADDVADDGETVTFTATLGTEQIGETETLTIDEIDPPGAPQNVVATPFTGRVTLDWDPPESVGDAPITHYEYRRKRGTGDFEDWELVEDISVNHRLGDDGTSLEFRDSYIRPGETLTYEVRAVNAGGPGPAQASNAIDLPTFTTFRVEQTEVRLPEGVGMVTFNAVMEVPDGWEPYDLNLGVTIISNAVTATPELDYIGEMENQGISGEVTFRPEDFKEVNGRWIATEGVNGTIVDDRLVEGEESFTLSLQRGAALPGHVRPDADSTKLTTTVVIVDNDELVWSVMAEPDVIGEDGGVSTVAVRTNDVEFTEDKTITLEFSGTATSGDDDFEIRNADGTLVPLSFPTFTLAAGETEVTATVTALADDVADDGETIVIQAKVGADTAVDPLVDIGDPVTITIDEIDPPGAPRNVVAEAFTGRVTLDWDPPDSEGDAPITHYEFRYKLGTSGIAGWTLVEDQEFLKPGSDGTSLVLRGLYVFGGGAVTYEVRAVNAGGPGPARASDAIDHPTFTRFRMEREEIRVSESVGTVTVNAVVEIPDGWGPYDESLSISLLSNADALPTALPGEDFVATTAELEFRPGDYRQVNGRWIATRGAEFPIVGDRLDEGEESFQVELFGVAGVQDMFSWLALDADATKLETTVVIEDDDELVWSVTAAPDRIREHGGVSAVTVRTNDVEFAAEQTIALTLGGTATPGTDFTVTDRNGATLASPYALTLAPGEVEVAALITALDDSVADEDETVTITARLGGNQIGQTQTLTIREVDSPSAPTNLVVMASNENEVMFQWDPPADDGGAPVTHYAYRYDANDDGVFVRWAYVGSTPEGQPPRRSWGIDVEADGHRVCVQVMAVNAANFLIVPELRDLEGNASPSRCATPYGPAEGAPQAPGRLSVTSTQADRADLEWDEPDESGSSPLWGYRIEVSTDGGDNWREVVANTGTPSLSRSDAGVADLASRLYRVSAVNTDERVGRRSPWARLAPMTLKEHLRPRAHQHFENAGDLVASSHSVTVAVELANPAPERRVHVRLIREGVLVATQVHEPEGTGFTATFGGPEEDGYALEPQTYYTVQADVVAGFDTDRRVEGSTFTLPDIRQGGAGPGRGVEVDTDGDGVAEADPRLTVAMGAAATFRVRPGACAGAKQVGVHGSLTVSGQFGPLSAEASPSGHTWSCAAGDDPGEWRPIELTLEKHVDAMLAAPFEAAVRHDVHRQRAGHQSWQPLVLGGSLVRLEVVASQALARVTGLAVEADDSPQVSWDAVAGAAAYQVQWRWGSEEYGRLHHDAVEGSYSSREKRVTGTSHTVAAPSAAKRAEGLTVRVRAYDGDALTVGPWREAVLGAQPGQPSELTATPDSTTAIGLAWEAAAANGARIQGYGIEVSEDGARSWGTLVEDTGTTATAYVHRSLAPGRQRFYRVRARNGAGWGAWSHLAGTSTLRSGQATGALTARMGGLPERHDGSGSIGFKMTFSEPVTAGEDAIRENGLSVTNGTVSEASRRDDEPGAFDMKVMPDSDREVTIVLPGGRPCAETGAICTGDGRRLAHALSMSVPGPAAAGAAPVLAGFVLVDAASGADLGAVADGATVRVADPSGGSYDFRAETAPGAAVGSVRLALAGPQDADAARADDSAPYLLRGGTDGGAALPVGSYTLTATAYAQPGGTGAALGSLSVAFTVARAVLTGFVLVDATAHADLGAIADGARLTELDAAKDYGFRAEVAANGGVASVTLVLSGSALDDDVTQTENHAPWSLYGDTDGNEHGAALPVGSYTLTATAWSGEKGTGDALQTLGVSFAVGEAQVAPAAEPLSARFELLPGSHIGSGTWFNLRVVFSEPVTLGEAAFAAHALILGNATVKEASRVEGAPGVWLAKIAPASDAQVTVALAAGRACGEEGALCTADGRALESAPQASVAGPAVLTGFELVDTAPDGETVTLAAGATVRLADPAAERYGLLATVASGDVKSVELALRGPGPNDSATRTENYGPWSLTGDTDGKAHGRALPAGSYTLVATAYAEMHLGGAVLDTLSVAFTVAAASDTVVVPDTDAPVVTGFDLVDTTSKAKLATLSDGSTVELADPAAERYGIVATVAGGDVKSVTLSLSGRSRSRRGWRAWRLGRSTATTCNTPTARTCRRARTR